MTGFTRKRGEIGGLQLSIPPLSAEGMKLAFCPFDLLHAACGSSSRNLSRRKIFFLPWVVSTLCRWVQRNSSPAHRAPACQGLERLGVERPENPCG